MNFDKQADPIDLTKGNKVVITNDGRKQKHENTYKGPFTVEEVGQSNVVIKDLKTNKLKTIHKNKVPK